MNDNRDDPRALLFTCAHCGFWPLAYQGERSFGPEMSFSCPRCRQATVLNIKKVAPSRGLEVAAG
jgi:predicted RNA-binding Zn-ribbon protein involved in translation (DUF1610 family)